MTKTYPKSCSRCHSVEKVDANLMTCGKVKENNNKVGWLFSHELAKDQALCDDRVNAELPEP